MRKAKIQLEHMSWQEVKDALATGTDRVVVGIGAVEQHGPHLPLLTDTLIAQTVAELFARRIGRALVAPTIAAGCSAHHLAFPGTISLRHETLVSLIEDYITSLDHHGFKTIILIPIHGGDYPPLQQAVANLAGRTRARVLAFTDMAALVGLVGRMVAAHGFDPAEEGIHAGQFETSLVWAIAPELVDPTRYQRGYIGDVTAALELLYSDPRGMLALGPTGIMGDPHGSSPENGRAYLRQMLDFYAEHFAPLLEG